MLAEKIQRFLLELHREFPLQTGKHALALHDGKLTAILKLDGHFSMIFLEEKDLTRPREFAQNLRERQGSKPSGKLIEELAEGKL